jgi:hypothetical protein
MNLAIWAVFAVIGFEALQTAGQDGATSINVTVTGCVTQATRTGSLADDSRAGVVATPATAPVDANSAAPVDAYLLTDASQMAPKAEDPKRTTPTSYALVGHEQELSTHKGHRVQIVGRRLPRAESSTTANQPAAPGIERIAVASLKMLSSECRADSAPPR